MSSPDRSEAHDMAFTRTPAYTASLLRRVQNRISNPPVELVYTPHDRWPIPPSQSAPLTHRPLRILVLDSSYNPPTFAHLALANSRRPSYSRSSTKIGASADYDAKLLLLSVRNVDKSLKPGDASYIQRLEMMDILSKYVIRHGNSNDDDTVIPETNIAVAIIDEPTFVGKSSSLRSYFHTRFATFAQATPSSPIYDVQLTFLLGTDTLERLISPRYYDSETQMLSALRKFFSPSPGGDDSCIVCAHRPAPAAKGIENETFEQTKMSLVEEFISSKRIVFVDIEEDVQSYSSSTVRNTVARLGLEVNEWRSFLPQEIAEYIAKEKLYHM